MVKTRKKKTGNKKYRHSMPAKWRKLICSLPNYDPFVDAGNCHFDKAAAQKAIDFFPDCLVHVKGPLAGRPFEIEIWEKAILANLFGWKCPDGTRRYREAFIMLPRKNGKTAFCAGIILCVMLCDGEPGAEIYSAATDHKQAKLVFAHAKGMVQKSPILSKRVRVYLNSLVEIDPATGTDTGSSYQVLSADAKTKDGLNTHLGIIDELHAQPNSLLFDVIETSMGGRRQPLLISITTSDYDRPSLCNEKQDHAEKICRGIISDAEFLPVIFKAGDKDDWKDPKVHLKANPNMGVSLDRRYFEKKFAKALMYPSFENVFKRLHLNIKTSTAIRWIDMDKWDKCNKGINIADLIGRPCYGGLDLSSVIDLSALELFFPDVNVLLSYFWMPEERARERQEKTRINFLDWAKKGMIKLTPGDVVDYDIIRADIAGLKNIHAHNPVLVSELKKHGKDVNGIADLFNIEQIAFDRWNATQITTQLTGDGIEMIQFGQGFGSMSAPTKELERLVIAKELNHGGNEVLRWMACNAVARMDAAGNIKPDRDKSTEKIDGIVAGVMAIGLAGLVEEKIDINDIFAGRAERGEDLL